MASKTIEAKLSDGTLAKVEMSVCNVPGQTDCKYGGLYEEGQIGTIKTVNPDKINIAFPKYSWSAHPSELIPAEKAKFYKKNLKDKLNKLGYKPGWWFKAKDEIPAYSEDFPVGKDKLVCRLISYYSETSGLFEVPSYGHRKFNYSNLVKCSPPKLNQPIEKRAQLTPPTETQCYCCGKTRVCYQTIEGFICKPCFNKPAYCCSCNKLVRNGDFINERCLNCFQENLKNNQMLASDFNLDGSMWLARKAADFYLLNLLYIETGNKEPLNKLTDFLADQFSRYMFVAIGGELRHCSMSYYAKLPADTIDKICDEIGLNYKIIPWFFLRVAAGKGDRTAMWEAWNKKAKELGTENLTRFAYAMFNAKGLWGQEGSSIGGKKWALIAKVLLDYLTGEITKMIFVDTAFGLKHNGAIHFSKVWMLTYLQQILDFNFKGNYAPLFSIASEEVKELTECPLNKETTKEQKAKSQKLPTVDTQATPTLPQSVNTTGSLSS